MAALKGEKATFRPMALVQFLLVCLILGFLIALHSRAVNLFLGWLWLAFVLVSSTVILWRWWKYPEEFKRRGMGQTAILPRPWQKWILGETDKNSSR